MKKIGSRSTRTLGENVYFRFSYMYKACIQQCAAFIGQMQCTGALVYWHMPKAKQLGSDPAEHICLVHSVVTVV